MSLDHDELNKRRKQREEYRKKYGPMNHMHPSDSEGYDWLEDPWPWEYCKNKEV